VTDPSASIAIRPIPLGGALRRAWVGYQRRLDEELAAAGFSDRSLPDGRVLRICAGGDTVTVSHIGRELAITRQGASKLVGGLERRGYLKVARSTSDGREKVVRLTPRAVAYLDAHRRAARTIERRVRAEMGAEGYRALRSLLDALGGPAQPRMRDYVRESRMRSAWSPSDS
jgi:DNA-binding MarR family transcriptional regulator